MQVRLINADTVPVPTTGYVQALEIARHERMLFVSGQTPVNANGTVPEGFEARCRLAWRNIEARFRQPA
ncbi:hypothetical protein NTH_04368 (plasmid) [Nitratireductor thuwali]|uniref:RidA family protein n=1 Tax=Nitratireductor thuwali TaxID=2267699 RepID=A0ABY5MPI2_9HYPH|nr:hypothetical protein NTH_04368 [Nitratireductor thuwali]